MKSPFSFRKTKLVHDDANRICCPMLQTLPQEAAGPPEVASQDQPALIPGANQRPRGLYWFDSVLYRAQSVSYFKKNLRWIQTTVGKNLEVNLCVES